MKTIEPSQISVGVVGLGLMGSICRHLNLLDDPITSYLEKLTVTEDYSRLGGCGIVLERVVEKIEIKKQVYHKIADVVSKETVVPQILQRLR